MDMVYRVILSSLEARSEEEDEVEKDEAKHAINSSCDTIPSQRQVCHTNNN